MIARILKPGKPNSPKRLKTFQSVTCSLVFLFSFLCHNTGRAYFKSNVEAYFGQSNFQATTATTKKNIDALSTLELNYALKQSSTGMAYVMSFFELVSTPEGYLTFTRFAVGPRWYPLGMNGNRVIIESDTTAYIWKTTPFLGLSAGIANMSVTEFNASIIDITPRFGVELPLTATILINGQIIFASSLSGSSGGSTGITYSGNSILIGLTISNFGD